MNIMEKITEQPSHYDNLEQMSVGELLLHINQEDALVAEAVRRVIPQIQALVEAIEPRMKRGGGSSTWEQAPVAVWVSWMPVNCRRRLVFRKTG